MIDVGHGPPLVLIPGMQGRWEWMQPTVNALARHFRVLSFTLAGEWTSGDPLQPRLGFDSYTLQMDRVLAEARVESAIVCGVSYGGLIALRYASMRPNTVKQLVLASALPPDYRAGRALRLLQARAACCSSPSSCSHHRDGCRRNCARRSRAWSTARGSPRARGGASSRRPCRRGGCAIAWSGSRTSTSRRTCARCTRRRWSSPATEDLDRTVPPALTRRYLDRIPGAELAVLERTGHMGTITRPAEFANLIA